MAYVARRRRVAVHVLFYWLSTSKTEGDALEFFIGVSTLKTEGDALGMAESHRIKKQEPVVVLRWSRVPNLT